MFNDSILDKAGRNGMDENNVVREFSFKEYMGPPELLPHVSFTRKGTHFCIYCGGRSDTREHAPSRVFLRRPYPEDLRVLPACKKCNNGFSDDELYTEVYIDAMKYISGRSNAINDENKERIYKNKAFLDAQRDFVAYCDGKELPTNIKISKVLTKLAVCHCVYELSEGYSTDIWEATPVSVKYTFAFDMPKLERDAFDYFIPMMDKKLPIIGSRVYNKLYVLEAVLQEFRGDNQIKQQFVVMNWTDVQDGEYKYVAWIEKDETMHVRMVIHDFLYAEIVFREK